MAKKSKKKSTNLSMIVSLICLVLSVLMVVSYFIPVYTYGSDDSKVTVNGVTLTKVVFMSEDDYNQAVKDSLSIISKSDKERAEASKLATVYDFAHSEDNASFKISAFVTMAVLVAGIVGVVFSVLAVLSKKISLGLLISTGAGMLLAILLLIFANNAVNYISESSGIFEGVVNIKTAGAIWVALVSSVLATCSAVTGKLLKK